MTSGIRGAFLPPLCTSMAGGNAATEMDQLKEQMKKYHAANSAAMAELRFRQDRLIFRMDSFDERLGSLQFSLEALTATFAEGFGAIRRLLGDTNEGEIISTRDKSPIKDVLDSSPVVEFGKTNSKSTDVQAEGEPLMSPISFGNVILAHSLFDKLPQREPLDLFHLMKMKGIRTSELTSGLLKPSNGCAGTISDMSPNVQVEGDEFEKQFVTKLPKAMFKKPKLKNSSAGSDTVDGEKLFRPLFLKRNDLAAEVIKFVFQVFDPGGNLN